MMNFCYGVQYSEHPEVGWNIADCDQSDSQQVQIHIILRSKFRDNFQLF